MKYMLLIYGNEAQWDALSPEAQEAEIAQYGGFSAEATQRNLMLGGEQLHPTTDATTVRVRDGHTLTTSGPFAETHEQLGGYYILDCKDIDEAIEMAAKIPGALTGSIEIRPIVIWE